MTLVHQPRRRAIAAVVALSLLALAAVPPVATTAASPGCSVKNTTKGTSHGSMKKAVSAASAGNRLELRGRCSGPITIGKNLTIVGVKTSATGTPTLTGNDATRVLWIKPDVTVTLRSLVIRDGLRPDSNDYPQNSGAGILLEGTATLVNVVVRDNVAPATGAGAGGIEVATDTARLVLTGKTVLFGNEGHWGGAIENYGTLVMKGSTRIHDNTARADGGGIYDGSNNVLIMRGKTRIDHNTALGDGGGVLLASGGLSMYDTALIDNNTATTGAGGGILHSSGVLTNASCGNTVRDNTPADIAPDCV